jgi:hypothetical protein
MDARAAAAARVVVVAALAAGAVAGRAGADAIPPVRPLRYDVSGTVGGEGITGREAIRFVGVAGGTLYDDASRTGQFNRMAAGPQAMFLLDLGTFLIAPPPAGESARPVDAPFALTLQVEGGAPVALGGVLRGDTVAWQDVRSYQATLDRVGFVDIPNIFDRTSPHRGRALPVPTGGFVSLLMEDGGRVVPPPDGSPPGTTAVRLGAAIFPVPEPASWLVLLSLSAGLVFRRRLQQAQR